MALSTTERDTVLNAVRLIAQHGLDAADAIQMAVLHGTLEDWQLDEAVAQLEDIKLTA